MLFYEELVAFQLMYNQELYYASKIKIVSESLSYSLIIGNPMIAVFIANMYPDELFHNKAVAIDTILHYLNEFTESNGGSQYRRIKHLEQYLFIVERMLCFFNFAQAKKLISIFNDFIDIGQDKGENASENYILKLLSKNVYLLCFFVTMLNNTFRELDDINQEVEQKYSRIVNLLLDATEDISQVELILTAKCFNRKEVIDLISECDFQSVLNNAKVSRVVTDFWKGPYETEFFMNNCYAYAQIRELFINSKKFFGYKPTSEYAFSVDRLWRQKSQKMVFEEIEQSKNLARYANCFHFKQWDRSLSTKYFIEAIFVIIGSLCVGFLAYDSLSVSQEARPIVERAIELIYQLETEGISDTERVSISTLLLPIADEAEEKIKEVLISIDKIVFVRVDICLSN